jgi:hypothetical protein
VAVAPPPAPLDGGAPPPPPPPRLLPVFPTQRTVRALLFPFVAAALGRALPGWVVQGGWGGGEPFRRTVVGGGLLLATWDAGVLAYEVALARLRASRRVQPYSGP